MKSAGTNSMEIQVQHADMLAEIVSTTGLPVDDAARHIGLSRSYARQLWNNIKQGLGDQAR